MKEKYNFKIIIIAIGLLISLALIYQLMFGFSFLYSDEISLDDNEFEFESTEVELGMTEMHLDEVIIHNGRVDGQLILSDALDHTDIRQSEISEYTWETDGEEYDTRYLNHFYNESGTHDVSLTITDTSGNVWSDTIEIETEGIQVMKTGTGTYQFSPPEKITGYENATYEWTLGHYNAIEEGEQVQETFVEGEIRQITLRIIPENENKSIIKITRGIKT